MSSRSENDRTSLARSVVLLCMCVCCLNASAARGAMPMWELLQMAVTTHPSVSQAQFGLKAAERNTEAARMQFWPTPSVQADGYSGNTAVIVRLTQPLWTGGKLTADLRYSEVRELRSQREIEVAQVTLALRMATVAQSYVFNMLRRLSQERAIDTLADLAHMIERRTEANVSANSDMNLIRARQGQAESDLALFRAAENTALSQLGQAVGRPLADTDVDITLPAQEAISSRDALVSRALEDNPQIHMIELDARLADIDIDRARAALQPVLSVRAEHQFGQYEGSALPGDRVYLSLQYTLGAGLSVIPQIEAARQRAYAAGETLAATRLEVTDRVDNDWRDYVAARSRMPSLADARQAAQGALESNRRLFIAGRRSWIDLVNSAREVTQAEFAEAEARSVAIGAYYRLAVQAGVQVWANEGFAL
jgi:outer membrane protein, adhesin transport system